MKCYNLLRDYDDNGLRKPDALPEFRDLVDLESVNKYICTDPDGFVNLKAWINQIKDEQ